MQAVIETATKLALTVGAAAALVRYAEPLRTLAHHLAAMLGTGAH